MGKLVVAGVPGLDGEYDLVIPPYTQDEWHEIKKKTGIRPLELDEAWHAGDPDVMAIFAWVAMTRVGKNSRLVWEELGKTDVFSVLTFDFSDEEDAEGEDADPLEEETSEPESEPEPVSGNESSSSGETTQQPLESPAPVLKAIGTSG